MVETFENRQKRIIREIKKLQDIRPLFHLLWVEAKKIEDDGLIPDSMRIFGKAVGESRGGVES